MTASHHPQGIDLVAPDTDAEASSDRDIDRLDLTAFDDEPWSDLDPEAFEDPEAVEEPQVSFDGPVPLRDTSTRARSWASRSWRTGSRGARRSRRSRWPRRARHRHPPSRRRPPPPLELEAANPGRDLSDPFNWDQALEDAFVQKICDERKRVKSGSYDGYALALSRVRGSFVGGTEDS